MKRLLILILFIAFIAVVKCNETPSDKADCSDLTAESVKQQRAEEDSLALLGCPYCKGSVYIWHGSSANSYDIYTPTMYECRLCSKTFINRNCPDKTWLELQTMVYSNEICTTKESISHTDTPEPVCPWCGEKEHTAYFSESKVYGAYKHNSWFVSQEGKSQLFCYPAAVPPDFYRCNSCNQDFTIDRHHLEHTENGITYTTDEWYYTTERIK